MQPLKSLIHVVKHNETCYQLNTTNIDVMFAMYRLLIRGCNLIYRADDCRSVPASEHNLIRIMINGTSFKLLSKFIEDFLHEFSQFFLL